MTPQAQGGESADERSARVMRWNHARVKHLLVMFFILHKDGASRMNCNDQ